MKLRYFVFFLAAAFTLSLGGSSYAQPAAAPADPNTAPSGVTPAPAAPAATTPAATTSPASPPAASPPAAVAPAVAAPPSAAAGTPPGGTAQPPETQAGATTPPPAPLTPPAQLRLEIANGTSIRFGLLSQLQYEARGDSQNDAYSQNIFLRRFSILLGGTILKRFEYFFDTDFANLLKAPTGEQSLKAGPAIQTKDAFATFRAVDDQLKFDGGLFLPPGSHNTLVGGSSINGVDFFQNTFRHSTAFGTQNDPYGRDLGFQARGLVLDQHLEYRAGVFQGKRGTPTQGPPPRPASRNSFRYAGRVQINFLDAEPGFFYAGTYLGKKKILSLGGSLDYQPKKVSEGDADGYIAYSVDALLDHPLGPGGITADVELVHRDGGDRVNLPKQTAFESELSYRIDVIKLSPLVRFERRWAHQPAGDETDFGGGLSFWAYGHNGNLKAYYTRLVPAEPARAYNLFNVQWQVFFY